MCKNCRVDAPATLAVFFNVVFIVAHTSIAICAMIDIAGGGVFTDTFQGWSGVLGTASAAGAVSASFVGIFGINGYKRVDGGSRASIAGLWDTLFVCITTTMTMCLCLTMQLMLRDMYEGEDPFNSKAFLTSNPRDRISGARAVAACIFTCAIFCTLAASRALQTSFLRNAQPTEKSE